MPRRRRSKKTTPLKEVGFLIAIAACFIVVALQNELHSNIDIASLLRIILLIVFIGGVSFYAFLISQQRKKQRALRAIDIAHVDEMPGIEFEKYVAALLRSRGYKTKMTPASGDYGVDIIAIKKGIKTAVQVKRYSSKLDQKPVREALAGMSVRNYGCTKAMVITNSTFTKAAKFLASEGGCTLVDREILGEWILEFQR